MHRISIFFFALMLTLGISTKVSAGEFFNTTPLGAQVSIVLDSSGGVFSEPESVYKMVNKTVAKIFQGTNYKVIPIEKTDADVQIYKEEHDIVETSSTDKNVPDRSLKMADLKNLGEQFDSEFVVYVRIVSSAPQATEGMMSSGQKSNVSMDFRIYSVAKEDYIYKKRSVRTGKSDSFYKGSGSSKRALEKGLKKDLAEVEKEIAQIHAAMK